MIQKILMGFGTLSLVSASALAYGPSSPHVAPTSKAEYCASAYHGDSFKDLLTDG